MMGVRALVMLAVCCQLMAAADRGVVDHELLPSAVWLNRPTIRGDDSALVNAWGHVTVVSLVEANSLYSRQQAQRLDELRVNLSGDVDIGAQRAGVGLHVVGINSRHWPASLMTSELSTLVNFTVYQSTRHNDYWSRLGGYKDDMFVYDRCGNLAYYLPFPHSYMPSRYVEAAILSTMYDPPCSKWLSATVAPSVNCTNSTDDVTNASNTERTEKECASFDQTTCDSVTARMRQSSSSAWRLAARCCRHLEATRRQITPHQHRHHHHQRQHEPEHGGNKHHHEHKAHRCMCLPSPSGNIHRCLCRPTSSRVTSSNCFCSFTTSQLSEQCSWQDVDSLMPTSSSRGSRVCSCHTDAPSMSPSWSWQESPSPYGEFASLSRSTSGYCQPHGQPLIWVQETWRWPMTSSSDAASPVSWSWRMEHGVDSQQNPSDGGTTNTSQQQSTVRWLWSKRNGLLGNGQLTASGNSWSWSETAVSSVGSLRAGSWECHDVARRSGDASWANGMPWQERPEDQQSTECRWQGQLSAGVVWQNNAEWNSQQQQSGDIAWKVGWNFPWRQSSSDMWGSNWRQIMWSWVNAEKAQNLWRQTSNGSWSRRRWDLVAGWSWAEVPTVGQQHGGPTTAVGGWSNGDSVEWVTVAGWRCDNNRLIVTGWQPSVGSRQEWRQRAGVQWPETVSGEAEWAWGWRNNATV